MDSFSPIQLETVLQPLRHHLVVP